MDSCPCRHRESGLKREGLESVSRGKRERGQDEMTEMCLPALVDLAGISSAGRG